MGNPANLDPITGEKGSHPIGTAMGATSAGIIGTGIGSVAGPLGALAGAVIGASVGGIAGHEAAEYVNPTYVAIEPHLQESFAGRPYAQGRPYGDYKDAYAFGANEKARLSGRQWDASVENELQKKWENAKTNVGMSYQDARQAIRDSWHAVEQKLPGDFDRDGR
jgi:hypothetical protein